MSVATLPCDADALDARDAGRIASIRATGGIALKFAAREGRSFIADAREWDGYKVRFPRNRSLPEAIVINTGGGLASGDRITQTVDVAEDATACLTTQASERVYRALHATPTRVETNITIADRGTLHWLPQSTILYDNARLDRTITVDMADNAQLLLVETMVLGRIAMDETLKAGLWRDTWRIRRGGKLAFAENVRLEDDITAQMTQAAIGTGHHVIATVVFVAPTATERLEAVRRTIIPDRCRMAASAWSGLLVVRALGSSSEAVAHALADVIQVLTGREPPRAWRT